MLYLLQIVISFQLVYLFFRNRFDFLVIFYASFLAYHGHIIYGVVWSPPYIIDVNTESINILLVIAFLFQIFVLVNDFYYRKIPEINYDTKFEGDNYKIALILLSISYLTLIYALNKAGWVITGDKADFVRSTNIKYMFFMHIPAAISLIYGVVSKRKLMIVLSLIPLALYLFIGFRATVIVSIIGVLSVAYYGKKILSLKMLKIATIVSMIFIFFVVYKISYIAFQTDPYNFNLIGHLSSIVEADKRFDSIGELLMFYMFAAEWGQISTNLVLTSQQDMSSYHTFYDAFFGSITLLNTILDIDPVNRRFSNAIELYANPGHSYGVGGTIWGEMFQAGGYAGVAVMAIIVLSIIVFINIRWKYRKNSLVFFMFYQAFLVFLVHKSDFTLFAGNFKNVLFLLLVSYLIIFIINGRALYSVLKLPSRK